MKDDEEIRIAFGGGYRSGKAGWLARRRDELLARGESVALISPGEDGKPHVCVVKPMRKR